MKPRTRTISGAILMLAIIPAIIGLLACMPVPIGDPERSRIDPDITGVWVWLDGDGDAAFYTFEPYDKRTWLLTGVVLKNGADSEAMDYDLSTYAALTELIENETVGPEGVTATEVTLYKAWRTKLGGEWFMTWEPKGLFDDEAFVAESWFAFRIDRPDANTLQLHWITDTLFEDVEETRRAYERVVKKNARNPELYEDDLITMVRIDPAHFEFVGKLAGQVIAE